MLIQISLEKDLDLEYLEYWICFEGRLPYSELFSSILMGFDFCMHFQIMAKGGEMVCVVEWLT